MSILYGQFAITLIVEADDALGLHAIDEAFAPVRSEFSLTVVLHPLPETLVPTVVAENVMVSVHGADRPGIVSTVSLAIADLGGNIIDLATHRSEDPSGDSYVLLISVETSPTCNEHNLAEELDRVSSMIGVSCVVHSTGNELL